MIVIPGGQRIGRNYKMGIAEGLERAARYLEAHAEDVEMNGSVPATGGIYRDHAEAIRELKESEGGDAT